MLICYNSNLWTEHEAMEGEDLRESYKNYILRINILRSTSRCLIVSKIWNSNFQSQERDWRSWLDQQSNLCVLCSSVHTWENAMNPSIGSCSSIAFSICSTASSTPCTSEKSCKKSVNSGIQSLDLSTLGFISKPVKPNIHAQPLEKNSFSKSILISGPTIISSNKFYSWI